MPGRWPELDTCSLSGLFGVDGTTIGTATLLVLGILICTLFLLFAGIVVVVLIGTAVARVPFLVLDLFGTSSATSKLLLIAIISC